MITKEKVLEEAKKLGLTLDDSQVNVFVSLGVLPSKGSDSASGNDDDDQDDDEEGGDLTAGMKKRLAKEKQRRQTILADKQKLEARLAELEKLQGDKTRSEAEKKGEYDKLIAEANTLIEKNKSSMTAMKETIKKRAIESDLKTALIAAGCPADRLPKALRLIDVDKIDFEYTNEDAFEYEISGIPELVDSFKKDNDFLFDSSQSNQNGGFNPVRRPDKSGKATTDEERKAALEKSFPTLKSVF